MNNAAKNCDILAINLS